MRNSILILLSGLLLTACSGQESTPVVPAPQAASTVPMEAIVTATASQDIPPATTPAGELSAGLRVAYLRDGNIWLWTQSGSVQLTNSGGVKAVRISDDGQMIAFEWNRELWAVQVDGSNERRLVSLAYLNGLNTSGNGTIRVADFDWFPDRQILYFSTFLDGAEYPEPRHDVHLVDIDTGSPTQWLAPGAGGILSFAPDDTQIAISNTEQIDVIDFGTSARRTLLAYSKIPVFEIYFAPQVVWMPDSNAFKTVIPPQVDNGVNVGQARFVYVGIDGMVAQLAVFDIVPLYESLPVLSPDGNYLLFVSKQSDEQRVLRIMGSSGAVQDAFTAAEQIRVLDWSPDSKRFFYSVGDIRSVRMGALDNGTVVQMDPAWSVRWVDANRFLFLASNEAAPGLYLGDLTGAKFLIDAVVTDFDFAL